MAASCEKPDPFDLRGKVAMVAGGNGGIGLGMARGLAKARAAVIIETLANAHAPGVRRRQ
jgi:NAD(P)-dependent dehydrogenase (short-subunit alcohol dehydrogenase family)